MFSPFKFFFERVNAYITTDAVTEALIRQAGQFTGFKHRFAFDFALFDPAGFFFVPVEFFRDNGARIEHTGFAVFQFESEEANPKIFAFVTPSDPRFAAFQQRFQFFCDFFALPAQRFAKSA